MTDTFSPREVRLEPGQEVTLAPGQTVELAPGQTVVLAPGQAVVVPLLSFGAGPDGTVTLDGVVTVPWASKSGNTYTMTRGVFCAALTINNGVTLIPAGYRLIAGALTNNGLIHNDGAAGNTTLTPVVGAPGAFYGGGGQGGAGISGSGLATAPANGCGGGGGPGNVAAIPATPPDASSGGIPRERSMMLRPMVMLGSGNAYGGGGGGSVGAGNNTGGAGAGVVAIFADTLVNNGTIRANGGNGGGVVNSGGGGGGGFVFIFTSTSYTNNGTVEARGGTANPAGRNGSDGNAIVTSFAIP